MPRAAICKREERGGLCQRLHRPLSRRGARRRPAAEARPLLRPHEGARRGVRLGLWLGAAELVRAAEATALGEAELDKPDVLLNDNHPPVADRRAAAARNGASAAPTISACRRRVPQRARRMSASQDMSAFAKCEVSGPGAEAWLDGLLANRIPKKVGRIAPLPHAVDRTAASARSSPSIARGAESFYLVSAGAWSGTTTTISEKLAAARTARSRFHTVTTQYGVLVLAGPRSRELLQRLTDTDLSNAAFPWLTGKSINVGTGRGARAPGQFRRRARLGAASPDRDAEHHLRPAHGRPAGPFGIRPFGIRAMMSMALEKSYRLIGRELSIEYAALESGLDRFVHPNKGEFLGRDALVRWRERGFSNRFVTHGGARRHRRRRARLGADLRRRRAGRPLHLRRLWLAGRQVAGARHGPARARRGRAGADGAHPRRGLPRDGDPESRHTIRRTRG